MIKFNPSNIKTKFIFSKELIEPKKYSIHRSSWSLFWTRFFSKISNWFLLILFIAFILFIIFSAIFYKYPSDQAVLDSELAINLPNYNNAYISQTFDPDSPELKFILEQNKINPSFDIVQSVQQVGDSFILKYNPYKLIEFLSGQKYVLIFGTNYNKIDRFSFFIASFGYTILITIITAIFQTLIGTVVGSVIGYYSKKSFSKLSFYLFNILNVLPFLIVCIILFNFTNYTVLNAIWIFSIFGSVSFFYTSYSNASMLKDKEFIISYKTSGMSDLWIIFNIILVENVWVCLSLISENISLNILALSSLAFFDVKGVNGALNLGSVFLDLINDLSNIEYLIFVVVFVSLFVVLSKILSISLYQAYIVQ
ncbi:ABC transporter permease subunit [Mycoplasmopsis felifaucium]|uniref:ABC transporter permease subunit n=1 Tax=Mycoplasmopsis felifaucium TaxID=35768 RepID=UPI00069023B4|nr:ABC transporter permease subunit [Mycoplasmopsis felifaucium]